MADENEVPEYITETPTFIEPTLIPADRRIRYDGPYGPHLRPANAAAQAKADAYFLANPGASLSPVEALPLSFAQDLGAVKDPEPGILDLAQAQTAKAVPGPTDGGKVK